MSTLIVYSLNNVRAAVDNLMLYSVFNYWGRLLISGTGRCPNSEAPPLPPPPPPPTLEITFIVRYFSPVTGKGARSLIKFALSHTKPTLLLSTRPFPSRHHPDFICLIARLKPPHSFFFIFIRNGNIKPIVITVRYRSAEPTKHNLPYYKNREDIYVGKLKIYNPIKIYLL
jgi:hypothetical protein